MFHKFQKHIMCVAVLAVAVLQIFGVRTGFLCECTGARSTQEKCETACHSDQSGKEVVEAQVDLSPCSHAGDTEEAPDDQNSPDHQHQEVRESLMATGLPPILATPQAIFFDLPPALQLPDFTMLMASFSDFGRPEPPEYGSPPMPQMVARTIVMMV